MTARLAPSRRRRAARPVRPAARCARSRDRRGLLARAAARPGRDDDRRRSRDHGGRAVLVALSPGLRPAGAGRGSRRRSPGSISGPRRRRRAAPLVQTRAVVSEALRLYPPAFTMVREAIGADRAAGCRNSGAARCVLIAPWVLHRHRRLWRDPEAFDPSRFLPGAPPPPRYAYLPFGAGPRVCVGAQFAMAEATVVLAAFVQAFRHRASDERPVMPRRSSPRSLIIRPDFSCARAMSAPRSPRQ